VLDSPINMPQPQRGEDKSVDKADGSHLPTINSKISQKPSPSRNTLLVVLLVLALLGIRKLISNPAIMGTLSLEKRAVKILEQNPLMDGHNDLLMLIRYLYKNHINDETFKRKFEKDGMPGHTDLPRLEKGKMGGAFWSAYVACPADGMNFDDDNYAPSSFPNPSSGARI
jgi:Membrane dipeptidase (Peptidase family M19)